MIEVGRIMEVNISMVDIPNIGMSNIEKLFFANLPPRILLDLQEPTEYMKFLLISMSSCLLMNNLVL